MADFVGEAVSQRLDGDEPSRLRALGAAIIIGAGAAAVAYRLLRSGGGDQSAATSRGSRK
jgi:hypothetical protein